MKTFNQHKQAGLTLMEVLAALAIVASVVVGSLSLFGAANSSSTSSQLQKDLVALRTATQALYTGQGGYTTASLNSTLIAAKKVPSTMTPGASNSINTSFNGLVTVTGATTQFTLGVTNVAADVCASIVSGMASGWSSVAVNGATAITAFPVTPATAATQCDNSSAGANSIVWTTNG